MSDTPKFLLNHQTGRMERSPHGNWMTVADHERALADAERRLAERAECAHADRRRLRAAVVAVVAQSLNYFDNADKINASTTAAEVTSMLEDGIWRYRNDGIFRAKVETLTARLMNVIDAAPGEGK